MMRSMHTPRRFAVALLALLSIASSALAEAPAEKRFLRYVESGDQPRLETSIVHYKNADGVTVDLIGAVHIADPSYFTALNERFKQYDAVLYEMVKPKEMKRVRDRAAGGSDSWVSMLQKFMKSQLDLSFQLDVIDYDAKNFVHADLDAETFAQKQEERGETMLTMMVESMLREMAKGAADRPGSDVGIMDLIEALQAPDRPRQLKIVMARQFESMDEALDALGGGDSVILGERNKQALKVMREQMEAGKKNMAIFYGAGHMKGMEELMTTLMGFKAVGEPEWLTAWDLREDPRAPLPNDHKIETPSTQPVGVP